MKTNSLFYRLPFLLLELAGLDMPPFHAAEVKQTAFRLDGVLLPPG